MGIDIFLMPCSSACGSFLLIFFLLLLYALNASIAELKNYKFICMNTGIEWESIDYHLSIESMLELSLTDVA